MREERREQVVQVKEVIVYVACDGTEFKHQRDCLNYEWEKIKKPMLEKLHRCKEADGIPNCNGGYVSDYNDYEWYFVRNKEDVDILNDVYYAGLGENDIGEWVCIEIDEESDTWYTTASDGIKYATDLLTKLGYKVEITKEAE